MIHLVDGQFVISAYGVWLPGAYETEQAARYAFRLDDLKLRDLQNRIVRGEKRLITLEDLKAAKNAKPSIEAVLVSEVQP